MNTYTSIFAAAMTLVCLLNNGCSRDNIDEVELPAIHKIIRASQGTCGSIAVNLTKTDIEYFTPDPEVPDTHRVKWTDGDVVYSYSASGVYMYDRLIEGVGDEASFSPSNPYEAKIEIIYREGDAWYNAYQKGAAIGDYIGNRTQYHITFANGIPNHQNCSFKDHHISIASKYPLSSDDVVFQNMQSFARFTAEGTRHGTIGGKTIRKITFRNLNNLEQRDADKQRMAGNLELDISVENGWKYKMLRRTGVSASEELKDTMITATPPTGLWFTPGVEYFVALPVRSYANGIIIEFFDSTGAKLSYVKTPRITIGYNQIYDMQDILKYVVILSTELKVKYGPDYLANDPTQGILIELGHTGGKLIAELIPEDTTNPNIEWKSSSTGVLEILSDGTLVPKTTGTTVVKATSLGGDNVKFECKVTVVNPAGLAPGEYGEAPYTWAD